MSGGEFSCGAHKKCKFCPDGKRAIENAIQINGIPYIDTDKPPCDVPEKFLIQRIEENATKQPIMTPEEIEQMKDYMINASYFDNDEIFPFEPCEK